jgi:hypothetical protein
MTYRPLPDSLTIANSPINGLGLFAVVDLEAGLELGITHIKDTRFENGYTRTPLGGFFNHSATPNCEAYSVNDLIKLRTIGNISKGTELTAKYWMYSIARK